MNSENSKTSKSHTIILNHTDETDLRISEKRLIYRILVYITYKKKII